MNSDIKPRENSALESALKTADVLLEKSYLGSLSRCKIIPCRDEEVAHDAWLNQLNKNVRFFNVTQIVLNTNENSRDKLASVFSALCSTQSGFIMLLRGSKDSVSIKLGVKNKSSEDNAGNYAETLKSNILGHFPGTKFGNNRPLKKDELDKVITANLPDSGWVCSVTTVGGLRSEKEDKEHTFVQGLEKFADTMRGKEYTLLVIADAKNLSEIKASRRSLENIYSALMPFSESQQTIGTNESINQNITESITDTINSSVTNTLTNTVGSSSSDTTGTSKNFNPSAVTSSVGAVLGNLVAPGIGMYVGGTIGGALGSISFGKSSSKTTGTSESTSSGQSETSGSSHSSGTSVSGGISSGTSESQQIKYENKAIKEMLKRIEKTLERYETSADLGMWNCAAYCISEECDTAQLAANTYYSIVRGKNSSLESGAVIAWDNEQSAEIIKSLKNMEHPLVEIDGFSLPVTPGTLISSAELTIHAGLPLHSLPGIPVIECAEFGRTVSTYDASELSLKNYAVNLGKIWHMNQEEELPVALNPKSLGSHTFITGSTGSGKSTTVYRMLSEVMNLGKKFLVIEPAKGEYKNIFGNKAGVRVYGVNQAITPLLRLNPFSFPHGNTDETKNIHILEHLDRLIEIFNVCWPMYAAMPAVLKEAIEKSYIDCGWDLTESVNRYNEVFYPTFADVTRNIKEIIDSSEYDNENKGAYKGSLITRLKSLTNGINGLIFTTNEIGSEELFDENTIIDLSRVGSSETKALIMGILVLKLQEYRMTGSDESNSELRHVTVLEEAHNLLKRTSTEQSQESGNLRGKSVEMLTNAIAEMRTYGEGFIIADQAPALLDMAVIRNTNTKIIMRLPDQDDRELVGKAANLSREQIQELAKLPCGVAAVYQNEWVEAVLCKVHHDAKKPKGKEEKYIYTKKSEPSQCEEIKDRLEIAKLLCEGIAIEDEDERAKLKEKLNNMSVLDSAKVQILRAVTPPAHEPRFTKIAGIVSELFSSVKEAFENSYKLSSETNPDTIQWTIDVDKAIIALTQEPIEEELRRSIRQCIITEYLHNELGKTDLLEKWAHEGGVK